METMSKQATMAVDLHYKVYYDSNEVLDEKTVLHREEFNRWYKLKFDA